MTKLLTSIAASLALLAAGPALAQDEQQQNQQGGGEGMESQQSAPNTDFEDKELEKFVKAQDSINDVRDEYMGKIESADDQEKAQELQQEANDEMVKVIEGQDLEIETYNEIATAYNSDPETRDRIDEMM